MPKRSPQVAVLRQVEAKMSLGPHRPSTKQPTVLSQRASAARVEPSAVAIVWHWLSEVQSAGLG